MNRQSAGKVILVGAGPGDPGLLTLRGRRALESADLVLYDYLVDPRTLQFCLSSAQKICLGRHGTGRFLTQDEIHRLMIDAASSGRCVVRLKGGDACLFGRLAEEVAALEAAAIDYEVVPGVTAASAASATTGIPLTHRDVASCVAFITGQQAEGAPEAMLDFSALAAFPGTLAFYMGVTSASVWSDGLLQCGKPADTPVAIVRHVSLPNQQTLLTTLGQVSNAVANVKLRPPAVIFVGEAVSARSARDWFASRPLFGQTVLVTRPAHQSDSLAQGLAEQGAQVLFQPAIEISAPTDWTSFDAALDQLRCTDWVVFSSANGVHALCNRLLERGNDLRALGGVGLASIGRATADALMQRGLHADLVPGEFRAEALADALAPVACGKRILLVRASRGREILAEMLTASGALVSQAVAYRSCDVAEPDPAIAAALADGKIDWITVTSSAIARSLHRMFGANLARARLAAISPVTASTLAEIGHPATIVAAEYDVDGVLASLIRSVRDVGEDGASEAMPGG